MNSLENSFEREIRESPERKVNEIVSEIEKECKFEVLKEFARYLGSLENIFINYSGDRQRIEDEYIELEIKSFSAGSGIDPSAFQVILSKFKTELKAEKIRIIADEIIEKCPNDIDDYREFIKHLEKVFLIFEEGKDSDESAIKERLVEEKIRQLSADGEPSKEELERISGDFIKKLKEKGLLK